MNSHEKLAVSRQCKLAGVNRSTVYARANSAPEGAVDADVHATAENASNAPAVQTGAPCCVPLGAATKERLSEEDELYCQLIDEEYTRHPFFGSRKMVTYLRERGYVINRKRVQRYMRLMGLAAMAPGPLTSKPHPQHRIYPYLLRGMKITAPNQVWSADVTYLRLERGFVYLVAIIDWYSRRVLSWRLSNSMEATFCVECLEEALRCYGNPVIFNSDQGSQFTSEAFTGVLKSHGITISMDGRGRALDNIFVERLWRSVKYEDVYLKGYSSMPELMLGLTEYFAFYNEERMHQALGYKTPSHVYASAEGGGAEIKDRFKTTDIKDEEKAIA